MSQNNDSTFTNDLLYAECTFEYIPHTMLTSGLDYQRPLELRRVKEIVTDYNKYIVNVVKVSFRDNVYYVIDGQHTVASVVDYARLHGIEGPVNIQCQVYYDLTFQLECEVFAKQLLHTSAIKAFYIHHANSLAGDSVAHKVDIILNAYGFELAVKPGNYQISAVKSIYNILSMNGNLLETILEFIVDTWDGKKKYLCGNMLKALATVFTVYEGDLNVEHLTNVLRYLTFGEIELVAKEEGLGKKRFDLALVALYNKSAKKKLDVKKIYENAKKNGKTSKVA